MSAVAWYAILMLGLAAAVIGFGLGPTVLQHFRSQRILADGVAAQAKIVSVSDSGSRVNGQPVANIRLEVTPDGAAPFAANARSVVTAINASQFSPGKTVNVKFSASDRGQVVIVGPAP